MSAPKRTVVRALLNGSSHKAFGLLVQQGLNPYLLSGAACSVESAWTLAPGTRRQAVNVKKLIERLQADASLLRRMNREGSFNLPDYGHATLCGLMDSAVHVLRNNFGAYKRQSPQNLYAAALVHLLTQVRSAAHWAGLRLQTDCTGELPPEQRLQNPIPVLAVYELASQLMRQGVPDDVLAMMRADFPNATGRVPQFPSPEALRKRFQRIKGSAAMWEIATRLSDDWTKQYDYRPGTWGSDSRPEGPAPPLAMLPKMSS